MKKYPSIFIAIILIIGLGVNIFINLSNEILILLTILGIYLFLSKYYASNVIGISFILIVLSILTLNGLKDKINPNLDDKYFNITGDIKSIRFTDNNTALVLTNLVLDSSLINDNLIVNLNKKDDNLKIGNKIFLSSKLNIPKVNYNPGEMNYFNYLLSKDISIFTYTESVSVIGSTDDIVLRAQASFLNYLDNIFSYFSEGLSSFLYSVFSGNNVLTEEDNLLFKNHGIMHILSVSGFHVILMDNIIMAILSLAHLNKYSKKKISLLLIFLYCFLIGFPVSAMRAFLFLCIDFLALILRKPKVPLKTLTMTAVIILIIRPQSIFNIGFQFSFLAVLAIITVYPIFKRDDLRNSSIINNIYFTLSISLLLFPLQIYHFNNYPLSTFIANLIVIPLLVLTIQLSIIYLIFSKIIIINTLLVLIIEKLYYISMLVINGIDNLFKYKVNFTIIIKELTILYILVGLLLFVLSNYSILYKYANELFVIILKLLPTYFIFIIFISNTNSLTKFSMINIGQGDSFILESKNNTVLFDTGGSFNTNNSKRIVNFLKYNKVDKIDAIFLSHFDQDHVGNLPDILEQFPNTAILGRDGGLDILLEKYNFQDINYFNLNEDDIIKFDNVIIKVLYLNKHLKENDNSMVLKLSIGNNTILLTGDIEEQGELYLLNKDIKSDIIKIPHHGSKTSSSFDFLNRTSPKHALLSVGNNNMYNLPNEEVVNSYETNDIEIIRTDFDGFTTIKFYDNNYKIYKYNELIYLNTINFTNFLYLVYFLATFILLDKYFKGIEYNEIKQKYYFNLWK